MKTTHNEVIELDAALIAKGIKGVFEITDSLVKEMYVKCKKQKFANPYSSIRSELYLEENQFDIIRRDMIKINYIRNNRVSKGLKQGFVYAIGNPSFPDYVKIGSAIDVYGRLNSYQTSSPNRDYFLISYFYSDNRLQDEKYMHSLFERKNEWCRVEKDEIKKMFTKRHKITRIKSDLRKLSGEEKHKIFLSRQQKN